MEAVSQAQVSFFLTSRRSGPNLDTVDQAGLRPALFAGYRDLTELRYDFPLVLIEGRTDGTFVESLTGIIDSALETVARGSDGERIRQHVLRLEQEIRILANAGAKRSLFALWDQAADKLIKGADQSIHDSLRRTRAAIKLDGAVIDCDAALPARLLQHAWAMGQRQKAGGFRKDLDRLTLKLSDILKSDYERSAEGRSAKNLQAAVGSGFSEAFNFAAMSRILSKALPKEEFPESRRKRISGLLHTLINQQFIPSTEVTDSKTGRTKPYSFCFDSCTDALAAFRQRMPKLVALAKTIAIAELEIDGLYSESKHDVLFDHFGVNGLDPEDLAQFPDYLVCINAEKLQATEQSHLMEILSSGLPIKILLQIDDILDGSLSGQNKSTAGARSGQIARMAIGLNEAYVMQSSSSNLFQFRQRMLSGLTCNGPALFSIFSGACATATGLPPYLVAAAAMESRAFPAFTYDPFSGPNWASRFHIDANAQLDLDWPVQVFSYEDEQHQRVSENLAFTLVDFVASDGRYTNHLARIPREKWSDNIIPVDTFLTQDRRGLPDQLPSLLMVDTDNILQKVLVDERLIREARRYREMWHNLQEMGGVHNSHAEILLARARKTWEERMQQDAEIRTPSAAEANMPAAASVSALDVLSAVEAEQEPERSPDEAYIETARCSTCNECTTLNNKMFAYNANQQAYIADINAGSYAQLVEAAESCQVSVIHPGKPRNPQEPGLEELLKRAALFA